MSVNSGQIYARKASVTNMHQGTYLQTQPPPKMESDHVSEMDSLVAANVA